jgi:hypothetical protein
VVPGDSGQGIKPSFVNAPKVDPASEHWRTMTANVDATLETYRAGSISTRKETRRVLDAALYEVEQQSLEVHVLGYLIGRLDEIDAEHHKSRSRQSE